MFVIKPVAVSEEKNPRLAELLRGYSLVDDLGDSDDTVEVVKNLIDDADTIFVKVCLAYKGLTMSGPGPPEDVTEDGKYVISSGGQDVTAVKSMNKLFYIDDKDWCQKMGKVDTVLELLNEDDTVANCSTEILNVSNLGEKISAWIGKVKKPCKKCCCLAPCSLQSHGRSARNYVSVARVSKQVRTGPRQLPVLLPPPRLLCTCAGSRHWRRGRRMLSLIHI